MSIDRRTVLQGLAVVGAASETLAESRTSALPTGLRWPSSERLALWPEAPPGHPTYRAPALPADWPSHFLRGIEQPQIHVFRPAHPDGRGVLVCPGGAYLFVSIENEGVDVARALNAQGITVFVLCYRLPCEGWSERQHVPLQDAQRAMRLLRHRAGELGIDPDRLGVLGFSAGGHLAASLATGWQESVYTPVDQADRESARPAHAALVYPVISLRDGLTHVDSRRYLLGETPSAALIAERSPERHVSDATPRCFIAHACDDSVVPVEHAKLFHDALMQARVPGELHLFEKGEHAFGIGTPATPCALWPSLYTLWLGA